MTQWYDVTWFLSAEPHLKVVVRVKQVDENWMDSTGNMQRAAETARARYREILGSDPGPEHQVRGVGQYEPAWS